MNIYMLCYMRSYATCCTKKQQVHGCLVLVYSTLVMNDGIRTPWNIVYLVYEQKRVTVSTTPPRLPDITWYIYTLVYIINTNKSVPRYFGGQSWNFPSLSAYSRTGNSFFRDQSLAWIVFLLCFFDSVIIFIQKQKVCFAHAASCAADDNSRHTERDNPMVATKSPRPYA